MARQSKQQKETVSRVMHEYKHGELETSTGKKVKDPKQAIAIGLREAGASKFESPKQNRENLSKTKAKEARGETAQARDEGGGAPSKAELYAQARQRNIPGRSSMTKAELLRAVRR
jgi:hypothetical protein